MFQQVAASRESTARLSPTPLVEGRRPLRLDRRDFDRHNKHKPMVRYRGTPQTQPYRLAVRLKEVRYRLGKK